MEEKLEFTIIPTEGWRRELIDLLVENIHNALCRRISDFKLKSNSKFLKLIAPYSALSILKNIFGIKYIIYERSSLIVKVRDPGGLPIGLSGKALSLFFGGF